jgi:hypothetical protein
MKALIVALALTAPALTASAAAAQPARLKPELAGVGFLIGDWKGNDGKVADTGRRSAGGSQITVEADGAALLRRDHTELFDRQGKPAGGFHQVMLIYPEGGTLHADYGDGEGHVIHYTSAAVTPGKSVEFTAPAQAAAPGFRLTYTLAAKGALSVEFGMLPPGGAPFHQIAAGVLHKAP